MIYKCQVGPDLGLSKLTCLLYINVFQLSQPCNLNTGVCIIHASCRCMCVPGIFLCLGCCENSVYFHGGSRSTVFNRFYVLFYHQVTSSRGGRGGKSLPNGKSTSNSAAVYRLDDVTHDNPTAIGMYCHCM